MNNAQLMTVDLITLPDADYFTFEGEAAEALQAKVSRALNPTPFSLAPGEEMPQFDPLLIAISAPKKLDINQRDNLPMLLGSRETGLRGWQVDEEQNLRVVAQDLSSGRVTSGRLETTPGKRMKTPEPSGSGEKPEGSEADSTLTGVRRYMLRHLLDIAWRPSRIALTVLSYDQRSNTVAVELNTGKDDDDDKTVLRGASVQPSKFLEANPAAPPEVPGPTGIALSIPRQAKGRLPVQASIKAPLPSVATSTGQGGKVLLVSLLLVKLDAPQPVQIDVAVPAKVQPVPGLGLIVEASFSFDARTALPAPLNPGSYQAYLIAGEQMAGPYPVDFAGEAN